MDAVDCVAPEDIPKIDLYMDQITTFLEEQLKNTKRHEDDKIFTKTMINNYSKNHLLPPSVKKKYTRNHMILLIYIYYLKSFLSISDIQHILSPLTDLAYDDKQELSFYQIYQKILNLNIITPNTSRNPSLKPFKEQKKLSKIFPAEKKKNCCHNFHLLPCWDMTSTCANR